MRASATIEDDCNVELLAETITGDEDDPNSTFCDINVAGVSDTVADDAVVTAVLEARAEACDSSVTVSGKVIAEVRAPPAPPYPWSPSPTCSGSPHAAGSAW